MILSPAGQRLAVQGSGWPRSPRVAEQWMSPGADTRPYRRCSGVYPAVVLVLSRNMSALRAIDAAWVGEREAAVPGGRLGQGCGQQAAAVSWWSGFGGDLARIGPQDPPGVKGHQACRAGREWQSGRASDRWPGVMLCLVAGRADWGCRGSPEVAASKGGQYEHTG